MCVAVKHLKVKFKDFLHCQNTLNYQIICYNQCNLLHLFFMSPQDPDEFYHWRRRKIS